MTTDLAVAPLSARAFSAFEVAPDAAPRPPFPASDRLASLDEDALDPSIRQAFEQRRSAIEAYARGDRLEQIESACGVHRSTVLRLVQRAQCPHSDGRLWGYRALVPHVRVQVYERSLPARVLLHGKAGNAGAFGQDGAR